MKAMKTIKTMAGSLFILSILLLLPGCIREVLNGHAPGSPIRFGANASYEGNFSTRTEYSGEDENGSAVSSSSTMERIDWVPEDDIIRILCPQASGNTDYVITATTASAGLSQGSASPVTGNGLQWGADEDHYFYAAYPAPGTKSKYHNTEVTEISGGNVLALGENNTATFTGTIPASQEVVLAEGTHIYKPNMQYAYMYAMTKKSPSSSGDVTLSFHPLVTTVEFTLLAMDEDVEGLTLNSLTLSSTSTKLAGDFTASLNLDAAADSQVSISPTGTLQNAVTVTFPAGTQLSMTEAITVTVLLLPVQQTDLTLQLNFSSDVSRSLALKRTVSGVDSYVTIDACKKLYINNLSVPGFAGYTLDMSTPDALTYVGGSRSITIVSYKTEGEGDAATTTVVPFSLQYSEDGTTWSTTPPSWLTAGTIDTGGSETGVDLPLTVEAQVNSAPDDVHRERLLANGDNPAFTNGENTTIYDDLSLHNVATGNSVARSTANCYVVDHPGNYMFPLVYGNGVKEGSVNESAYRGKKKADGTYRPDKGSDSCLGSFLDHKDEYIYVTNGSSNSPYLTTHLGKTGAGDFKAVLIWEDAPGLIDESKLSMFGEGEDTYLRFTVPAAHVAQGNALLAVLVDDDGDEQHIPETIAWSWHIWVTDENLADNSCYGSNDYIFSPVPVGWTDGRTEFYAARSCQVRAKQKDSGLTATITLTQVEATINTGGSSPYYQWGRKDPIQAWDGNLSPVKVKTYYSSSPEYLPQIMQRTKVSVGTSIKNPFTMICAATGPFTLTDWSTKTLKNLWSSTIDGDGSGQDANAKTKTIYDPSPVGFRVPSHDTMGDFTQSGATTWDADRKGRAYRSPNSNLFFPALGFRTRHEASFANVGEFVRYWLAQDYSASEGLNLAMASNACSITDHSAKTCGFPVFPVKEKDGE